MAEPDIDDQYVKLTRKRWTLYFVPAIGLVTIVVLPIPVLTGNFRLSLAPLSLISVRLIVRKLTPRDGCRERPVQGTPGMPTLLGWLACCLVAAILLLWWDFLFLGRPFSTDLTLNQILWGPVFIAKMVAGVVLLDRRYDFSSRRAGQERNDSANNALRAATSS